jgi:hypothetical protein
MSAAEDFDLPQLFDIGVWRFFFVKSVIENHRP